ncbi:STAS domain-containing protein [Streptodolium elevatio]
MNRAPVPERHHVEPPVPQPPYVAEAPEEPVLRFVLSRDGEVLVLTLIGDLDIAGQHVLDVAADRLADHDGPIRIDLSGVEFCTSTGVHFLDEQRRRCAQRALPLQVVGARPQSVRVLAICGLSDLLWPLARPTRSVTGARPRTPVGVGSGAPAATCAVPRVRPPRAACRRGGPGTGDAAGDRRGSTR